MHPASHLRFPTGRSSPAIFPTRPKWPRQRPRRRVRAPRPVHVSAESFSLSRWSAREGSGRAAPRNVLAALNNAVAHGMDIQNHLVTRLYSTGPPADSRQMLRARHLDAPLFVDALVILHHQLDEHMGIGPAEILDGA